jgi:hypothetical protein
VLKAGLAAGAIAGTGAWRFATGDGAPVRGPGALTNSRPGSLIAAQPEAAGPYSVAAMTITTSESSYTVPVGTAVPSTSSATDGLVIAIALGGATPPTVIAVTDTQQNTYVQLQQGSSSSPHLAIFAPAAFSPTAGNGPFNPPFKPLSTSDSFSITLSGTAAVGCVIAYGIPGQPVVDVSVLNDGTGTTASVAGTPRQAGETALAIFAWPNAGGTGTIAGPFTQLAQQHATSSSYLTVADASATEVSSPLTASCELSQSANWYGVLLTFSAPYAGVYLVASSTGAANNSTYQVPVQAGSPLAPAGRPGVPAGDGAVLVVSLAGSSLPAVQSVTDTKGNTWTAQQNPVSGAGPHLIVYTCPVTSSLTTADTVTVTFASATPSAPGFVLAGASQRGQVEVSTALVTGDSARPSVTGTPANGGEVVLSCFAWASAGGTGSPDPAWTRIGQAQTGGGAYATVDYYGTAQPRVGVTSQPTILTAAWRAVMISFKPTATLWFTNTSYITQMNAADPSSTTALFSSPYSMGITADTNGSNPPDPGSLPGGFETTPILKYTSYAQFQADLTAGPKMTSVIPAAYNWLMYDNEYEDNGAGGNTWPTPMNEANDPWTYMRLFVRLAHSAGYQVILTPARDLGNDSTSVLPMLSGESLDDWYIRTGIAYTAAATGAEVVHIQTQADQAASPSTQFDNFFAACVAQIEQASDYCRRTAGVSTTSPTGVTDVDMHDSATSVATTTQGYWLNLSDATVSTATGFEDLMLGG